MSYTYRKLYVDSSKWKIKCPYLMNPIGICVHNTANDAPAINEANYHNRNNNKVSYHIAVDDKEAIEVVPLNRMAFHAGDGLNGKGNRNYIGIEICYSKSGGEKYRKAEQNAIKLIAMMLYERKWDISRVKKHEDFSGKYCPHRILAEGRWSSFINAIKVELDKLKGINTGGLTMDQYTELKQMIQNLAAKLESEKADREDHTQSEWHKEGLDWSYKNGLIKGNGRGLNANGAVTYEILATVLKRYDDLVK